MTREEKLLPKPSNHQHVVSVCGACPSRIANRNSYHLHRKVKKSKKLYQDKNKSNAIVKMLCHVTAVYTTGMTSSKHFKIETWAIIGMCIGSI